MLVAVLVAGLPFQAPAQGVVLNEVMASNGSTLADEDGEFHDWIELFNRGAEPVNLQGWGLSDDASQPFRWMFSEVTLMPGDYLVVWASGKDRGGVEANEEPALVFGSDEDIPGLVIWLQADKESYGDGSSVAVWQDRSGRGNHAAQPLAAHQPVFRSDSINGKPAMEFSNSARRFLELPTLDFNGMNDLRNFTYILVANWAGASGSGLLGAWDRTLNNGNLHFEVHSGGDLRLRVSALDSARATGVVSENAWTIIGGAMSSGGDDPVARLFVDGTEVGLRQEDPGNAFLDDYKHFLLGNSRDTSRCFDGKIAEALLFNRALSAEERRAVETYLGGKYGLASPPVTGPQLHTNFRISASGEEVILTRPDGDRADAMPPSSMRRDMSVGRQPDGTGEWLVFLDPTPGGSNGTVGYKSVLSPPAFSQGRGFYSEPFNLELIAEAGVEIYYTLDGSEPSPQGGARYTGSPILIDQTTVVRAAAYQDEHLPSPPVAGTFLFVSQILRQPPNPEGFPSTWGGSGGQPLTVAHYKMDQRIIEDPDHARILHPAFLDLPVLSISMDVADLFEPSGIYSNPNRSGRDWERPASVEFFTADGAEEFQVNGGIRIQGGTSTQNWKVMKLSMRLFFREEYGSSRLQHSFFPDSPVQSYRTLVLGAGHNLTWQHPDHGQRVLGQYVRDVFVPDLHRATGALSPHDRFVHLFLNGLYWGFFYVQDRPDATFMAGHLGGSREDYDVLRHNGNNVVDGNNASWNAMMNIARGGLASREAYESIQEYLDVPGFIDYMIVNFWAGNTDWPRHNWYAGRRREPGAGFLFFSWDAEHVLKSVTGDNRTGVRESNTPGELYDLLRANAEFRLLFSDRVHRLFFNGGPLHVDPDNPQWDPANPHRNRPAAIYMNRIDQIDRAMALESARWGDTRRPNQPYTRNNEWMAELGRLLNNYFPQRSGIVLGQLRNAGLYPDTPAPMFIPHGGVILNSFPLVMNSPSEGSIYYTVNGEDPRVYGSGAVSPEAQLYTAPVPLEGDAVVKARVLRNGDWSALNEATFVTPPATPYVLAGGPYVFEQWDADAPAGSYPGHMIFEQVQQRDPALEAGMDGYWTLPYNFESRSRINGLGGNGIAFINTANAQEAEGAGYLGSALLALDTRGAGEVWVQWTAGTVTPNSRLYGLRLQYRTGAVGAFSDVLDATGNPLQYVRNALPGHSVILGPLRLPETVENQPYMELRWKYHHIEGDSGARAQLRLDDIRVMGGALAPATRLVVDTIAALPSQAGALPPLTVRAVNEHGLTDIAFNGPITLDLEGVGALSGTLTLDAVEGVAVFQDLAVDGSGFFRIVAAGGALVAGQTEVFSLIRVSELVMPRFIQGESGGENLNRVPFAFQLRIEGLVPEATYRYGNRVVIAGEAPDQNGAGNMIFVTGADTEWIRNTDAPRFRDADFAVRHHTFTAGTDGSYMGWFVTEPSGNARFTPGNTVYMRLLLNDGAGGEAVAHHLTTASPVTVLRFGEGPEAGSAITGQSSAGSRSFVLLHDDASGQGRALVAVPVEVTGAEVDDRYAAFYQQVVASDEGLWGAIIPNDLASGVRRVEERLARGSLLQVRLAAEGFPGTVNASTGMTPVLLESRVTFDGWRAANFLLAELEDALISGAGADPRGLGMPNLLRYAFGLSLEDPIIGFLPTVEVAGEDLVLRFRMDPAKTDLIYLVYRSLDLEGWSEVIFDSRDEAVPAVDGGWFRLILPVEGGGNGPRFFRLGVAVAP